MMINIIEVYIIGIMISSLSNSYYVSYTDSNISPYLNFSADGNINKGDTISISVIKYTNYN